MRDTFGGSDASGAWNWRMAYDMMQAAAVQTILLGCERVRPTWCCQEPRDAALDRNPPLRATDPPATVLDPAALRGPRRARGGDPQR